jgi:hypothetical protein
MEIQKHLKDNWLAYVLCILGAVVGIWGGYRASHVFYQKGLELRILELEAENRYLEAQKSDLERDLSALSQQKTASKKCGETPVTYANQPVGPSGANGTILITIVPAPDGGSGTLAPIEGRIEGISNPSTLKVILYARTDRWWVQPFADQPLTDIAPNGEWHAQTHLGQEYAALLVLPSYAPPSAPEELPPLGNQVLAKVTAQANKR